MNQRFVKLLALGMTAGMLGGCAGKPVTVENVSFIENAQSENSAEETEKEESVTVNREAVKTGLSIVSGLSAENAGEKEGTASTDISLVAVTVDEDGVIDSCVIDAIQGKVLFGTDGQLISEPGGILSKNELGEQYGMKQASSIGREWNEQAAAVADYAIGKTVDELKNSAINENGAVKDADLASSATIYIGGLISGIEDAVNRAEHMGAVKGDELILTSITSSSNSTGASETDGNAQIDANIAVMTMKDDVITSCLMDSVQSKVAFDANGAVVGEVPESVLSKNELGEQYGLKQFSSIGKEWKEQAASFCEYVTGKTAEEVAGIAVDETTVPTEADLVSSVTIKIGDFMALIEKAAK